MWYLSGELMMNQIAFHRARGDRVAEMMRAPARPEVQNLAADLMPSKQRLLLQRVADPVAPGAMYLRDRVTGDQPTSWHVSSTTESCHVERAAVDR